MRVKRGLTVGLVVVMLLGLALIFSQETGYTWTGSTNTYVNVTCRATGLPIIHCQNVKVRLYYGNGSFIGEKKGSYSSWQQIQSFLCRASASHFCPTLGFHFGRLDQSRGFIIDVTHQDYISGWSSWRRCSFGPRHWGWGSRVLRIMIDAKGNLLRCEG